MLYFGKYIIKTPPSLPQKIKTGEKDKLCFNPKMYFECTNYLLLRLLFAIFFFFECNGYVAILILFYKIKYDSN